MTTKTTRTRSPVSWISTMLLLAVQPLAVAAQDDGGEWSARISTQSESRVQLRVWRWDRDDRWESRLKLDEATTAVILDQLASDDPGVRFTVEREAGTLDFEGTFTARGGRGDFTFSEAPDFRSTMRELGYGGLDDDEVFSAAILDVGPRKAREMTALGFDRLDFHELISASIFDIDADFVDEMRSVGFEDLRFDELVAWRVHDIDADFVRYARDVFDVVDRDHITALKIHGVDRAYLEEMEEMGYPLDDIDDAVAFRIHGVTPDFVRELEDAGFEGLDADELVRIRIMGLDDVLKKRRKPRRRTT